MRSIPLVLLAYVLAAIVGGIVFGIDVSIVIYFSGYGSPNSLNEHLGYIASSFYIGTPLCFGVEILFVTPIIWAFNKFRWFWINIWSCVAIGYLIGFAPAFFILLTPIAELDPASHAPMGYIKNGLPTIYGLEHAVCIAALLGVVGAISALAFWQTAVRRLPK